MVTRVAVTGAAGRVGRGVLDLFCGQGKTVVAIDSVAPPGHLSSDHFGTGQVGAGQVGAGQVVPARSVPAGWCRPGRCRPVLGASRHERFRRGRQSVGRL